MKKVTVFCLVLIAVFALLFISSCSDDETIAPEKITINAEDSTFVNDALDPEGSFETIFDVISVSMVLLDHIPTPPPAKSHPLIKQLGTDDEIEVNVLSYAYDNGWHVFSLEALIIDPINDDSVDVVGTDSVQVLVNDVPVPIITEQTEISGIKERVHVTWDLRSPSGDHGAINHLVDLDFDYGVSDTLATLDGITFDSLSVIDDWKETGSCDIDATHNVTIAGLQMIMNEDGDDCPEAGSLIVNSSLNADCAEGDNTFNLDADWIVTATVNQNGTITVTFSNGIVSWTVTETCP